MKVPKGKLVVAAGPVKKSSLNETTIGVRGTGILWLAGNYPLAHVVLWAIGLFHLRSGYRITHHHDRHVRPRSDSGRF